MSETFLYLTTVGRKTGNPHTIEIWYVEHDDHFYLCAEHRQQADWVKNIMANNAIQFYIAQRDHPVEPQAEEAFLVIDDELKTTIAQKFDEKYSWSNGLFIGIRKA